MRFAFFALTLSLAGCAAAIPPVEVTRFHADQPLSPGGFGLVRADGGDPRALEFRTYAVAVTRELERLGYSERPSGVTYNVEIEFTRGTRTDFNQRPPVQIGVGGGSFGGNVGIGIGTSFGVGSGTRDTIITRLLVRIKSRADNKPLWEGRAQTQSSPKSPAAQPGLAADKLATALFQGFPGKSGETITVR